jgi:hypothetical protein
MREQEEFDYSVLAGETRMKIHEYKTLNRVLANVLLNENSSDDDIAYYTRKLHELRSEIKTKNKTRNSENH